MKMKTAAAFIAVAWLSMTTGTLAQQSITLTIAAGQAPRGVLPLTKVTEVFIPDVNRRIKEAGLDYKIEWREAYAGSLLKPLQMLDGIKDGIADIGFIPTLFYPDRLPLENISYALPFVTPDVLKVSATLNHLHATFPEFAQQYEKYNQIRIGGTSYDSYELLTTRPVRSLEDVKGMRLASGGAVLQWLRGTGAAPVSSNMMEFYNSSRTGVYDGFMIFASAIPGMKYPEAAPYVTKIGFGAHYGTVLTVNRQSYEKLPKEVQKILHEAGAEWALVSDKTMQAAWTAGLEAVPSFPKAELSEFPRVEQVKWAKAMPNIAQEWAKRIDEQGLPGTKALDAYMNHIRSLGAEPVRHWDKE